MSAATLEFSLCVCVRVHMLPRGKKNIKLSNQGATDRAFGTTEEPNGCVGCAVAEPSRNGIQLSAGQANLCPHATRRPVAPSQISPASRLAASGGHCFTSKPATKRIRDLKCSDLKLVKVTTPGLHKRPMKKVVRTERK